MGGFAVRFSLRIETEYMIVRGNMWISDKRVSKKWGRGEEREVVREGGREGTKGEQKRDASGGGRSGN